MKELAHYGAGFLFAFKACPVLDTGAQQQARSTGKCKCRLNQDAGAALVSYTLLLQCFRVLLTPKTHGCVSKTSRNAHK